MSKDNVIIAAVEILLSLSLDELEAMLERLLDRPEDDPAIAHAICIVDNEISLAKSDD